MKKNLIIWLSVFVGLVVVGSILSLSGVLRNKNIKSPVGLQDSAQTSNVIKDVSTTDDNSVPNIKNAIYVIDGQAITLKDGVYKSEIATDGASQSVTSYFGNDAQGDLNGDGKDDRAFLISQDNSGSGTFYYLAGALATDTGYKILNTILLGDRISPQPTGIKQGVVIVNYADRQADESMSTAPSVGVSKYFKVINNQLVATDASAIEAKPAAENSFDTKTPNDSATAKAPTTGTTQIANPASTNCVKLGGNLVTKARGDGGQYSICRFNDGSACEEWALMRGDCQSGNVSITGTSTIDQKYCIWAGGKTGTEKNSICTFKNGSKCSTLDFFNGVCPK
jgi:putative hemolysin